MDTPAMKMKVQKETEPEIGLVQGVIPDSKNEFYVAMALDKLGLDYTFQYSIDGGTNIRGGQVIDFIVWNPRPIPVFVQGEHWHTKTTESEDLLKQAAAYQRFGIRPVLLMGEDTDTVEKAFATVKSKIL
mgnify:CR=1 FL=1